MSSIRRIYSTSVKRTASSTYRTLYSLTVSMPYSPYDFVGDSRCCLGSSLTLLVKHIPRKMKRLGKRLGR